MRACSSASGGVMFIPDDFEEKDGKSKPVSYRELAGEKSERIQQSKFFGRKKPEAPATKAA
ncbi:MAG: hypothetical protein KDJ35_05535 [Alphaproteobacteria bacterium]|nr:hypothetical protein [Alphaproteobacteria bacterium]